MRKPRYEKRRYTLASIYDIREERKEASEALGIRNYSSLKAMICDESVDIVICETS